MRLEFTDTIEVIKSKIRKHLNLSDSTQFNMIEVQPLQNTFCQLSNVLNEMKDDSQAKDSMFTNQSTWMLLVD